MNCANTEALDAFEKETNQKVVSHKNFKHQISEAKEKKRLRNRKIIDAVFDGLFFRHFSQKNNSVTKAMQ